MLAPLTVREASVQLARVGNRPELRPGAVTDSMAAAPHSAGKVVRRTWLHAHCLLSLLTRTVRPIGRWRSRRQSSCGRWRRGERCGAGWGQGGSPERRRIAVRLYGGYTLVLLAFECFVWLVFLPANVRQRAWLARVLDTCGPGAVTVTANSLLLEGAVVASGLLTMGLCTWLCQLNRRLGLSWWGAVPRRRRSAVGLAGRRAVRRADDFGRDARYPPNSAADSWRCGPV
jgi:hypothetical protein